MREGFLIKMSEKEIIRSQVLERILKGIETQKEGSLELNISVRQVKRLTKCYRKAGLLGIVSKRRGRRSKNAFEARFRENIVSLIRVDYSDFGPTLVCEKLAENWGYILSRETVRKWMLSEGIWQGKKRKSARIHAQRDRRFCVGELVQVDGSPHDWFEGRREKCTLLVWIDDATSQLLQLRFEETETTAGYFRGFLSYLSDAGRPEAIYTDKHGIFRVNQGMMLKEPETQFSRAMRELDIEMIYAHSPQAKGRVERVNRTLQDRLVKELRLHPISTLEGANAYLPVFVERFNVHFAKVPAKKENAHRKDIPDEAALKRILGFQEKRTLSKNLEMSYRNVIYQIQAQGQGYGLRQARITVYEDLNGNVELMYKGRLLNYCRFVKAQRVGEVVTGKQLEETIKKIKQQKLAKPAFNHPWRQAAILATQFKNQLPQINELI